MVESYANVDGKPSILRIESTTDNQKISFPPFIKVLREVTEDRNYDTYQMADLNYRMPDKDKAAINDALSSDEQ